MHDMFGRIVLLITGILFASYGVWCLFDPEYVSATLELPGVTAQALTEIRAMYGGVQLALGVLFILAAFIGSWVRTFLWILLVLIGALAITRTFGAWLDHTFDNSYIQTVLIYEWVTFILSVLALRSTPRASA